MGPVSLVHHKGRARCMARLRRHRYIGTRAFVGRGHQKDRRNLADIRFWRSNTINAGT